MATSRYATQAPVQAPETVKTTGTTSGTSSQNSSQNTTQHQDNASQTINMSPQNQAILGVLIQQLQNGGTKEQQQQIAQRLAEENVLRAQRAGYSKEAAFGDAQGAVSEQMRKALEATLPSITRSAEGAGTSQNALRALLVQDAANKAAESSATVGLNAAVQYGGVSNNISALLEKLLSTDSGVTTSLINALNVSKGATTSTTGSTDTTGTQTGSQQGTTTQQTNTVQNTNGGSPTAGNSGNANSGGMQYFGPQQTDQSIALDNTKYAGSSIFNMQALQDLLGGNSLATRNTF